MSKVDDFSRLMGRLRRAYPSWPSTFSPCPKGCKTAARGYDVCHGCIENELGELIGYDLADLLHESIRVNANLYSETVEMLRKQK